MVIIDAYNAVKDNLHQKVRNPILGTILLVWFFKNWRLFYGLLTFDEGATQVDKINYIEGYFSDYNFFRIILESIAYAFAVLLVSYFLMGAARYIVDFYDNIILPRIIRKTNPKGIVEVSRLKAAMDNFEASEIKFNSEREARMKAQSEREQFEKRNAELLMESAKIQELINENERLSKRVNDYDKIKSQILSLKETLSKKESDLIAAKGALSKLEDKLNLEITTKLELQETLNKLKSDFSRYKNESEKLKNVSPADLPSLYGSIAKMVTREDVAVAKKLESFRLIDQFLRTVEMITRSVKLEINTPAIQQLMDLKLIKPLNPEANDKGQCFFELTDLGRNVSNYLKPGKI